MQPFLGKGVAFRKKFEAFNFFGGLPNPKRKYEADKRLELPDLQTRKKAEDLLYEIGKNILSAYQCFKI